MAARACEVERAQEREGAHEDARRTSRRVSELVEKGLVDRGELEALERVAERFSVAITPDLVDLVTPGDPNDPIAKQFLPSKRELRILPEERVDPIGDEPHTPVKGITHRYPDRLLLKPVHVCPAYCRFCFRREKVGPGSEVLSREELAAAIEYVRAHEDVWEVILSGGDPLILPPRKLAEITAALAAIEHVRILRVHTRVPVMEPGRIDEAMIAALRVPGLTTYVVLHTNHPRELGAKAREACARIVDAGIPMLSQTVLLRGVNADAETLKELFRELVVLRVKPYYLHHGDLAVGTGHFRTSIAEGQSIMRELRQSLSGIAQPTYVLDIPGGYGKVPIGPGYLGAEGEDGRRTVEDPWGRRHAYPPGSGKTGD
ncbi:lysine-2,3-aminomutase-like protein [Polyangium sp. y55x31]|uniref:lysine-2,3-aminomutase-like protein n=1 Tax=Polyangium sp. y55x31 TaxID=3042688 RepID=UPI002482959F|nr:lysine-2,3-aminomutase-like protein [Polyangium sp. y55x31]MDI1476858.1 lysine-2,3-aminomutase-like protein [Polyangium sp. y55x31]